MREPSADTTAALRRLVNGYQVSQALHVLVRLGIPDLIGDEPRSASDLAAATRTHEQSLYRLLRALAAIDVLEELPDRRFGLAELGRQLRSDAPGSLAGWAAFIGRPYHWYAWARLIDGVTTGEHAFRLEHGMGPWEYRQSRPDELAIFNRAMNSSTSPVSAAIVRAFDFSNARTVVDVGGGGGILLTEILKASPASHGILFDLPGTVQDAGAFVRDSGVGERCELVGGNFFEAVTMGADVYILKSVLHDWYDDDARRILATIRAAARPDTVLLVIEAVIGAANEGAPAKFSDLNMMVAAGGQERTRPEWEKLLADAGWRLEEIRPAAPMSLLVTRPI